ncbi:uncharacterized protein H6S33_005670 [Morchella sextelata]|uniref:uncharacterized protein n=1 Tax=Morchella sextelata TaxID=1174677 RepID=UPI001D052737|nr:uncharacterized protein H6S33_005670 [Morchella sextelata]KAH0613784.1 hypothetical protein H6S33_005670 [Morchella sextelata]
MTHVSLHRCRFVDYTPPQITSIAFTHPSTPSSAHPPPPTLRAAIGRTNGSIEIWNPLGGSWHHESTLQGGQDRSIEGLTWVQDHDAAGKGALRLFSIGYSSVVTEWDLAAGRPKAHLDCNGGVIWSIAAQPRWAGVEEEGSEEETAQKIVVGTEDGALTVVSTAGGAMTYVRGLMRVGTSKSRVLSLVWKDRYTVVAGMADSTIRVWDVRSGRSTSRMSLNKEKGREVLVWSVKVLPNGDIVSGDSRGEVCFWDGKNYTLQQRIKSHEGDCLAVEVGGINGDTVISGGVDMRTIVYKHIGGARRWGQTARRRFHKHDVRAMAAYECGKFSVVLSGGVDMTPIVIPLRQFAAEHQLALPAIPQTPIVTTVPEHRLMMSWWGREIKIWRIEELDGDEMYPLTDQEEERGRKLISRIMLNNEENLTSAAITPVPESEDFVLAISTIAEIKLFHLKSSSSEALRVRKITIPTTLTLETSEEDDESDDEPDEIELAKEGARLIKFSPNGKSLLVITPDSRILTVALTISGGKAPVSFTGSVHELERQDRPSPAVSKQLVHNSQQNSKKGKNKKRRVDEGSLHPYDRTINRAAFSSNSSILAVADLSGWIDTFVFKSGVWSANENGITLPKLKSAAAAMEFRPYVPPSTPPQLTITEKGVEVEELPVSRTPDEEDRLLVVTAKDNHILEFNILQGRLSDWSRRNPSERLPHEFRIQKDRAAGIVWEVSSPGNVRAWIWATSWVWMFDLSQDLPATEAVEEVTGQKRKRDANGSIKAPSEYAVKGESGAGDKVLLGQSRGLIFSTSAKSEHRGITSDDEDDDDSEIPFKLIRDNDEDDEKEDDDENLLSNGDNKKLAKPQRNKPFWRTNRYRNLMAFLPVGRKDEFTWGPSGDRIEAMEMVVVERPSWDMEMPPRFYQGTA